MAQSYEILQKRYPELVEFFQELILEIQQTRRPAEETILDDVELRSMLNVSKRTTATWRQEGLIKHSRLMGKIYYKLSDVLAAIEKNAIPAKKNQIRIKI